MGIQLTKDADKLICLIYKDFLTRRKNGVSKGAARDFPEPSQLPAAFLSELSVEDISETLLELKKAGFVKVFIYGDFQLEDSGIIYMEQRFPNGISQVLDWMGKVKSAIPFA